MSSRSRSKVSIEQLLKAADAFFKRADGFIENPKLTDVDWNVSLDELKETSEGFAQLQEVSRRLRSIASGLDGVYATAQKSELEERMLALLNDKSKRDQLIDFLSDPNSFNFNKSAEPPLKQEERDSNLNDKVYRDTDPHNVKY